MMRLTNTAEQTVTTGNSVLFNNVSKTGCSECHRLGTGSVKMCRRSNYDIYFKANVTGATAGTAVTLALALNGEVVPNTAMVYTPATANAVGEVSISYPMYNGCCDYDRVSVVNTGTEDVIISANPLFVVRRTC